MKVRAILNPRAGVAAHRALEEVRRGRPSWKDLEVRVTEGPGDARDLAREAAADGAELVLAVGGDGTLNEVAWGMMGSGATLGIVPVGSGNGLARTLGIPLDVRRALPVLEEAVPRRMDVGWLNDRPFLNVAGAGFDGTVGAAFHHRGRNGGRRGIVTYVRLGLAHCLSYRARRLRIDAGGERIETTAFLVAFVNGRQYGGGAMIAPRARLDDGRIELVVIEDTPRIELLLNAPRLFLGTLERFRGYRRVSAAEAVVAAEGPIDPHRDGEPDDAVERLVVRVEPRALTLLVPRATAEDPHGPFLA
jgi:YegS/Rv2252/BmrU family lipid kinase